jgi:hypothetical protein
MRIQKGPHLRPFSIVGLWICDADFLAAIIASPSAEQGLNVTLSWQQLFSINPV